MLWFIAALVAIGVGSLYWVHVQNAGFPGDDGSLGLLPPFIFGIFCLVFAMILGIAWIVVRLSH